MDCHGVGNVENHAVLTKFNLPRIGLSHKSHRVWFIDGIVVV
jgi:hypothetical protein